MLLAPTTFIDAVNKLFFGVDVCSNKDIGTLIHEFDKVNELSENVSNSNIFSLGNLSLYQRDFIRNRKTYVFKEEPFFNTSVKYGYIVVDLNEMNEGKIRANLNWSVYFESKMIAGDYFNKLNSSLQKVSAKSVYEEEIGEYNINYAVYYDNASSKNVLKNISIILSESVELHQYEVRVFLLDIFEQEN